MYLRSWLFYLAQKTTMTFALLISIDVSVILFDGGPWVEKHVSYIKLAIAYFADVTTCLINRTWKNPLLLIQTLCTEWFSAKLAVFNVLVGFVSFLAAITVISLEQSFATVCNRFIVDLRQVEDHIIVSEFKLMVNVIYGDNKNLRLVLHVLYKVGTLAHLIAWSVLVFLIKLNICNAVLE